MIPNYNTKMITLIGTPLNQSFAARMQNVAYEAADVNFCYFYTEADETHLKEILDGVRYMPSFAGCAITKPNKVAVLPLLDELDPMCEKIGACNTVVKTAEGKLRGYNTDCAGFVRALELEAPFAPKGQSCFCFGAGGAGRAICFALAAQGAAKIYIFDTDPAVAEALAADINRCYGNIAVPVRDLSKLSLCGAVFNATGVGMGNTVGQSPMPAEAVIKGRFYFDACYNPLKTAFLRNAELRGGKICNGLGMSLYQGAAQMILWTGRKPPLAVMRQELEKIIAAAAREQEINTAEPDRGLR